jgi:hypothetical protein
VIEQYSSSPLASLERAVELLASSRDLHEIRQIRDMAEAARQYAIAIQRGLEAQNHAAEIKIRAERRAGELLADMPKQSGARGTGANQYQVGLQPATPPPSYEDLGIEKTQAHRWQQMATVPPERFEAHIERVKASGKELSSREVYDLARQPRPVPEVGSAEPPSAPLLRFCQDLPTATMVSIMLRIYFPSAQTGLDPTYGSGNFHDGSAHVAFTCHDKDPARAPHGPMDVTDLRYGDLSFDVVLFDGPHIANGGDESIMAAQFGTADEAEIKRIIMAGTRECWRVCGQGLIVKITDHVHGGRYVLESGWVSEAMDGAQPYDIVHQVRARALIDPRWGPQQHAYNNGSTYLIFKRSFDD